MVKNTAAVATYVWENEPETIQGLLG